MRKLWLGLAAMLLGLVATGAAGEAQTSNAVPPRLPLHLRSYFKEHPEAWRDLLSRLPPPPALRSPRATSAAHALTPTGGTWQTTVHAFPDGAGASAPLLLTDGTVIVHAQSTPRWYRLTPDSTGSYINGTWTQIASLPSGYAPLYFASAVLPDGRVIINGGEYNNGAQVDTNLGAIYDPSANTWTSVSAPGGWSTIGDAQSIVLSNGTYMLADCCSTNQALLNAGNLSFSATGTGKFDINDEEGWSLLPDGSVLTVDAYVGTNSCGMSTERYNPSTGGWVGAGNTPSQLSDCGSPNFSFELGPQVLRPNGTLIAFGGTTSGVAHTAIFDTGSSRWSAGPDLPTVGGQNYNLADAPAALLPSGNVLFAASPGLFSTPVHFFEFNGTSIAQINDNPDSPSISSFYVNFLVLPTGQILATDFSQNIEIYTPTGSPDPAWRPSITSVPAIVPPGSTNQLAGLQLNGLSQGAAYGDDNQSSSNYPLVRITNNATGQVFYAKTFGSSTHSIAPQTASKTNFVVPAGIETGPSTLVVVANGIASTAVSVDVGNAFALSVAVSGGGTVTSSPSGINCGSTCSANFGAGTSVTLSASPAAGSRFVGWSGGGCGGNGTGNCTVTLNSNVSVSAVFAPITFSLAVSRIGSGTVTSSPSGIDCGTTCTASFNSGTQITLNAAPAAGFSFAGWSGAGCGGTGSCTVSLGASQSVTATFTQITHTLSVGASGNGSVTSSPAGIACGSSCSATFPEGSQVALTATPGSGFNFAGWSGAGCGGTGSCTVTMSADQSVSAAFAPNTANLSVSVSGNGRVTSWPAGIDCPGTCGADFPIGTQVSLAPSAAAGSGFTGWGGACGGIGTCTVTLTAATSLSASFAQGPPPASPLLASVLPASRSVQVGGTATAFVAIINSGNAAAPGCSVAPASSVPANFVYQTTDPATNALTGSSNTPADIPGHGLQTFVIGLTPNAAFGPVNLPFSFACQNVAPAPVEIGLNTLLVSASTQGVPDIVALAATARNDGIVHVPGSSATGAFAVATVNVGADSAITATTSTGSGELPVSITLCQTNPDTGACLAAPAASVATQIAAGATPTFGIFVTATGAVPFDPANNRVFVQFAGPDGAVRGATSVAVATAQ